MPKRWRWKGHHEHWRKNGPRLCFPAITAALCWQFNATGARVFVRRLWKPLNHWEQSRSKCFKQQLWFRKDNKVSGHLDLDVTLMPSESSSQSPSSWISIHPPVNTPSDPSTPHQTLHLTWSRCATLLASTCLDLRHEVSVSLTYEMRWMRYWPLPEGGSWWFYHSNDS